MDMHAAKQVRVNSMLLLRLGGVRFRVNSSESHVSHNALNPLSVELKARGKGYTFGHFTRTVEWRFCVLGVDHIHEIGVT